MKKIIMLMMMVLTITVFGEKLTTDGKDNLDKLKGEWSNGTFKVIKKNNEWYMKVLDFNYDDPNNEYLSYKIKLYKNGILVVQNYYTPKHKVKDKNYYFAWDLKYKTMVELDKDANIIQIISRKLNKPSN